MQYCAGWRGIRPARHSAPRVSPEPEYRLSSFTSLRKAPRRPDRAAGWRAWDFKSGRSTLGLRMFKQSPVVRDYIFPLASAQRIGLVLREKRILGSAFLIGNRGFALTAKHVLLGSESEPLVGIFALPMGGWFGFGVLGREVHPTEDVALVQLDGGPWKSFLRISGSTEHASGKYRLFGYPDDATYELGTGNQAVVRPDLVYNEGYIRRRFDGALPSILGRSFYELSQVAGSGASGAPVCKLTAPVWDVMGVYVGEKLNDRATSVSYAVREEAFRDWAPQILGTTVLAESQNVAT